MQRMPLMAGNWKMNNTISEAVVLAQEISNNYEKDWKERVDVVICAPSLDLKPLKTVFEFDKTTIFVGAQNVHWEKSGAFTGEISVPMIAEAGCTYCIVGHSERRSLFGETNEMVNRKVEALLDEQLTPIICVGESLAVRKEKTATFFVGAQVQAALAGIDAADVAQCVIAYEPIWAIGTGRTATPEQAQEICTHIRCVIADMYDQQTADAVRILYGGSVNPGNVAVFLDQPDIDGGLVGGASLEAASFLQLIKACL